MQALVWGSSRHQHRFWRVLSGTKRRSTCTYFFIFLLLFYLQVIGDPVRHRYLCNCHAVVQRLKIDLRDTSSWSWSFRGYIRRIFTGWPVSGDPKQSVAADKTSAAVGVSCRFSRSASVPADLAVRFGTWCQCRALTHPFTEQTRHPTWVVMRRALSYTTSSHSLLMQAEEGYLGWKLAGSGPHWEL